MNQESTQESAPIRSNALVDVVGMATFVAVIKATSFTGAAKRLNTSKSVVSRRIADIEQQLGVSLIDRTAVRVTPTEVGAVYFAKCVRILGLIESANDFVAGFHGGVRGHIRVAVPAAFCAGVLAPLFTKFAQTYPELKVEIEFDEREDVVQETGFDLALRIGRLADSSLLIRTLSSTRLWLCASPGYIGGSGSPKSPEQLIQHDCLLHTASDVRTGWHLQSEGQTQVFRVRERLRSACYFQLLEAAKAGLGIGLLPGYLIADAVENGSLRLLMPDHTPPPLPISLIYPSSRKASQKVQAMIAYFIEHIQNPPEWEARLARHIASAHST